MSKRTWSLVTNFLNIEIISVGNGIKHDLHAMQNDAMRFCKGIKLLEKVSIPVLHNSIELLSLEQRRQKQLLKIMYSQSHKNKARAITNVNTRSQAKYVCKTEPKIGKKL